MSTELEFKRECEGLVREYFTHGVVTDVEDSLKELLGRPGWTGTRLGPRPRSIASRLLVAAGARARRARARRVHAQRGVSARDGGQARSHRGARPRRARARDGGADLERDALRRLREPRARRGRLRPAPGTGAESPPSTSRRAPDDLHVSWRARPWTAFSDQFLDESRGRHRARRRGAPRRGRRARRACPAPGGGFDFGGVWTRRTRGAAARAAARKRTRWRRVRGEPRRARGFAPRPVAAHVPFYHHDASRALVTAVEESRAKPRVAIRIVVCSRHLAPRAPCPARSSPTDRRLVAVALKEGVLDTPDAQEIFERLVAGAKAKGLAAGGALRGPPSASAATPATRGEWTMAARARRSATPALTERLTERAPRASRARAADAGGGHLMRLDSAPDLIARARAENRHAREEPRRAPRGGESPRRSRTAPLAGQGPARLEGIGGIGTDRGPIDLGSGPGPDRDQDRDRDRPRERRAA